MSAASSTPIAAPAIWYLALFCCQIAVWPLLFGYSRHLPDRGYSAGRLAGLLLAGWICWTGWAYGLWGFGARSAWFCLIFVAVLSWCWVAVLRIRTRSTAATEQQNGEGEGPLRWIRRNLLLVTTVEGVCLLGYLALLGLRSVLPVATHTEQPSDLMFLSSIAASSVFPPHDAWMAGFPISYYYFGYWLQIFVGKLAGVPPTLVYNLGLASLFSLLCTACFGVGYNLVRAGNHRGSAAHLSTQGSRRALWRGLLGGGLAVAVVCLAGNLRTLYDLVRYAGSRADWWWLSSRAIRDLDLSGRSLPAITEFPAFSFVLGDNHPHVQSLPFLVLLALVLLNRLLGERATRLQAGPFRQFPAARRAGEVLVPGFLLGALAITSSWDLLAGLLLVGGAAWSIHFRPASGEATDRRRMGSALVLAALELTLVAAVAIVAAAPGLLQLDAPVRGFLPNLFFPTRLADFIAASGVAWLGLLLFALRLDPLQGVRARIRSLALIGSMIPLGLGGALLWSGTSQRVGRWVAGLGGTPGEVWSESLKRWGMEPFVALGLVVLIWLALQTYIRLSGAPPLNSRRDGEAAGPAERFVTLLCLSGFVLLLVPEVLFVHDSFGSRVNTVFKLHYSAWLLLGLAGAYGLSVRAAGRSHHGVRRAALGILAATLLYPASASISLLSQNRWRVHDLDALAAIRDVEPDHFSLFSWIEAHLPQGAIVLQAPGHREDPGSSRISVLTGHPTPVGWIDHERQWRTKDATAELERRVSLAVAVYTATDRSELERSLGLLGVRYVLVGDRERRRFGIPAESSIFDGSCRCLYSSGPFRIYDCAGHPGQLEEVRR
ncbi:MAG: DUF2298 domain-containing protein [Acidobacteriota bacterium]